MFVNYILQFYFFVRSWPCKQARGRNRRLIFVFLSYDLYIFVPFHAGSSDLRLYQIKWKNRNFPDTSPWLLHGASPVYD